MKPFKDCIFAAVCLMGATLVSAQGYPAKPIRFMVPFAPGGGIDTFSRAIAPQLQAGLGQPVVVENRPASAGILGADAVAKSAPDGYTIMPGGSWMVVGSLMYKALPYNVDRDFTPIALMADASIQIMIHSSVPANNFAEFIEYAKANPGKLNFGSAGVGHPFHLTMEMFKQRTGTHMVHIPYKGMNPAVQDFITGRTQVMSYSANTQLTELIKSGKLRVIATATEKRLAAFPEAPTMDELGIRNFRPAANLAMVGPAGIPRPIVDRLHAELVKATATPEMAKTLASLLFLRTMSTPDEYAKIVRNELDTWGPLIKSLNISLDQ
ncbi:MAG: tripartite tricarboxylate transporter substrate binding protein [Betaproteobacteria bacterium]|nr:tripartite tricarboxylate transporter substrate binding protein [Betaproteobacteria bacterium]